MKRVPKELLRFFYIVVIYALCLLPVLGLPLFGQQGGDTLLSEIADGVLGGLFGDLLLRLSSQAGFAPEVGASQSRWIELCLYLAWDMVFVSAAVVLLWNAVFMLFGSCALLQRAARPLLFTFLAGQVALQGYLLYGKMVEQGLWLWLLAFPRSTSASLLTPMGVTALAFLLCAWFLSPRRLTHVFPGAKGVRSVLGIRY